MFVVFLSLVLMVPLCACTNPTGTNPTGTNPTTIPNYGSNDFQFMNLGFVNQYKKPDNSDNANVLELNDTDTKPPVLHVSEEALQFLTGSLSTIIIPSFYTLVCLISLPINLCAVVAFGLRIRPKKPASIYMLNLACADLLFAALLPFKISYHFGGNHWMFGGFMCRVVTATFYWNMYCSVLLIACISVDRLLGIVYPMKSLDWRTPFKATIACATMWILSFAVTVPLVLSEQTFDLPQLNITTCHDFQTDDMLSKYHIYFPVLGCAFFFLPLLVTVVSYTCVIWSLSRVPYGVQGRSQKRTRAVVMAVTVLVIFVLCFTPTNVLLMKHYLTLGEGAKTTEETTFYAAFLLSMCLGSLNVLLDPLVYYFGSFQCQKELASMFKCEKVCPCNFPEFSISGLVMDGSTRTTRSHNSQFKPPSRRLIALTESTRANKDGKCV